MQTKLLYFDESGDDGIKIPGNSSDFFVLSGICVSSADWRNSLAKIKAYRNELKKEHDFPVSMEFHTYEFIKCKEPSESFRTWPVEERLKILRGMCDFICSLELPIVTIIYDKLKADSQGVLGRVLETVLKKCIDELEKLCRFGEDWNYFLISDEGRLSAMRKAVRKIPNQYMIEEVFEKDSKHSYFIQLSDYIATFTRLHYRYIICGNEIPQWLKSKQIDKELILDVMNRLGDSGNVFQHVVIPK